MNAGGVARLPRITRWGPGAKAPKTGAMSAGSMQCLMSVRAMGMTVERRSAAIWRPNVHVVRIIMRPITIEVAEPLPEGVVIRQGCRTLQLMVCRMSACAGMPLAQLALMRMLQDSVVSMQRIWSNERWTFGSAFGRTCPPWHKTWARNLRRASPIGSWRLWLTSRTSSIFSALPCPVVFSFAIVRNLPMKHVRICWAWRLETISSSLHLSAPCAARLCIFWLQSSIGFLLATLAPARISVSPSFIWTTSLKNCGAFCTAYGQARANNFLRISLKHTNVWYASFRMSWGFGLQKKGWAKERFA
mmetsp:Transcript_45509/g.114620  ORF Transcript_45509/g.114620 Transcript_45509/m.114620 type:complete len:303 (+) Transcript_45509:2399-3307(+)